MLEAPKYNNNYLKQNEEFLDQNVAPSTSVGYRNTSSI